MKKLAIAVWKGAESNESVTSGAGKPKYAWSTGSSSHAGTDPEELITAAHAGCFNMKLSAVLTEAGYRPDTLETMSILTLENGTITNSHLVLKARVPGISKDVFSRYAEDARANCYVTKLLNTSVTMESSLA